MRGLEKNRIERGQSRKHTHRRTSRLLDQIGPVGRFDENQFVSDIPFHQVACKEKVHARLRLGEIPKGSYTVQTYKW